MLTATPLHGIMDIAQQAYQDAAAAANAAGSPSAVASTTSSGFLSDLTQAAKDKAAAEKMKATWVLVGVGAGGLVLGLLLGRYAIPKRKRK